MLRDSRQPHSLPVSVLDARHSIRAISQRNPVCFCFRASLYGTQSRRRYLVDQNRPVLSRNPLFLGRRRSKRFRLFRIRLGMPHVSGRYPGARRFHRRPAHEALFRSLPQSTSGRRPSVQLGCGRQSDSCRALPRSAFPDWREWGRRYRFRQSISFPP